VNAADGSLSLLRPRRPLIPALMRALESPRLYVYLVCTVVAVLVSRHLGKEMLWDTMDYHVYAGFSALHDRFGQDYFAAGPQAYFNPYSFVPFYLLLRSALTPLEDASILAALQSGILWLTYEMAIAAAPRDKPKERLALGVLAALLALANPVLINQFGSSFNDITTAEIALAGWLVLLGAVSAPGTGRVVCAALLLGVATALKPTNAVHAVSAAAMLPFIRDSGRARLRHAALFAVAGGLGFVLVSAPWSMRLEHQFGNPLFPLLNGVFRSPEYTTAPLVAYRFIPTSFAAALLRPFEMAVPSGLTHVEWIAPDLRYALLLVVALLLLLRQVWQAARNGEMAVASPEQAVASRAQAALGCGFLVDWILWLLASGNSRYFIPMACIASVLGVALIQRVFSERAAVRNYLLAAAIGAQLYQLYAGTEYRAPLPWPARRWFSLSLPAEVASQPNLYFMIGEQSNSYIIPYLPAASGFVNLEGEYNLGAGGPNGTHIQSLIKRFGTHLRVLVAVPQGNTAPFATLAHTPRVEDAIAPFGLKIAPGRCATIVARGVTGMWNAVGADRYTEYLVTCSVIRSGVSPAGLFPGQRAADLAFDHLEDACPALFQPRRPADSVLGDGRPGYTFERRYPNTEVVAWIGRGRVRFQHFIGGDQAQDAGLESGWENAQLRVVCQRQEHYIFRLAQRIP
jgi:hypothetical protein